MKKTGDINETGKNSVNITGGKVKGDIKIGLDEKALIENARKNLHAAVTEEYISADKVGKCCAELKNLLPEDPLANFYETAVSGTPQELAQSLLKIDCHSFGLSDLEEMATVLIKSLKHETCNSVAMLIDRIGEVDPSLHERVGTRFDEKAQEIDKETYNLTHPRNVFVAYRSTDMDKVVDLVDYLENTEKLECFVSYRNLQHGIGAKDHYDEWLNMAMDSCQLLVFVSSVKSRREGDARHKELPYVEQQDKLRSPAEYRAFGDYTKIPQEYKKPRVEYLIEPYTNAKSEGFAKVFFDGFTRRESPESVAQEIFRILDFGAASLQGRKTVQPATTESAETAKGNQSKTEVAEKTEQQRKVIYYVNGDVYEGQFKDDKRNGHGVYRLANGDVYDGEFKNGNFNGHGVYRAANGDVYDGEFKDGQLNGHGVLRFADGGVYDGELKDSKLNGHGVMRLADGRVYDGKFKDNKRNGHGVYRFADGGFYVGEFKNDKYNGHGVYRFADGGFYVGEFKDDVRNGYGIIHLADGMVYDGEWKDGKVNGHGVKRFANGDVYDGEFADDSFNGHGVYRFANGDVYDGEFKDHKRNGHGVYRLADGRVCEGEWKDGKFVNGKKV